MSNVNFYHVHKCNTSAVVHPNLCSKKINMTKGKMGRTAVETFELERKNTRFYPDTLNIKCFGASKTYLR